MAKQRSGSAVGFRGGSSEVESAVGNASMRLVVMGNYCAELLRTAGQFDHAKKILNKIEILTSVYAQPFTHKTLLRVWTLCNMGMLHADKGLPVAGYDFLDTARAEAQRADDLAALIVLSNVRAAFLCRSSHFDGAAADVVVARSSLARLLDMGLQSALGPAPNVVAHHLRYGSL